MKIRGLDSEIDKLTNSIENRVSGDQFRTTLSLLSFEELKKVTKKSGWVFNWKNEFKSQNREVFKLTIEDNPQIIQGIISLEEKEDHVFMHLLENSPVNKGHEKMYIGVAGNLVAFACKISLERGHEGNVAFISKTQLIEHYVNTLGAFHFGGRLMILNPSAALNLVNKYFNYEG
ncbi:hypothetical protein [Algoriphagus sp.]|uniref:hypothetical protein n=1 Tax=Algoriphagus sp. TaxID=1872435 RepID=UPI003919FA2F